VNKTPVLYGSKELQKAVLSILKNAIIGSEIKYFRLVSPWISNFSFDSEIIMGDKILSSVFPSNLLLLEATKQIGEHYWEQDLEPEIVLHDFSMKSKGDLTFFPSNLTQLSLNQLLGIFTTFKDNFSRLTKFNQVWLYKSADVFRFNQKGGSMRKKIQLISKIGSKLDTIQYNQKYLKMLSFLKKQGFLIYLNGNFHAKMLVTETAAIAGSSNWTYNGFNKNDEINIYWLLARNIALMGNIGFWVACLLL